MQWTRATYGTTLVNHKVDRSIRQLVGLKTAAVTFVLFGFCCVGHAEDLMRVNKDHPFWKALSSRQAEQAVELAKSAADQFRSGSKDDVLLSAQWLSNQAYAESVIDGHNDEADQLYHQACDLAQSDSVAARSIKADCLAGLSMTSMVAGQPKDGLHYAQEALKSVRPENTRAIAKAWSAIAYEALSRKDLDKAYSAWGEIAQALARDVSNVDPFLADTGIVSVQAICENYLLGNREDEVKKCYLAEFRLMQTIYTKTDVSISDRLVSIAPEIEGSEPLAARDALMWAIDLAFAQGNSESAQFDFDQAIAALRGANFEDDVTSSLWKWKQYVENKYGASSIQHAHALVSIGENLYEHLSNGEGEKIFLQALSIAQNNYGVDSDEYRKLSERVKSKRDFVERMKQASAPVQAPPTAPTTSKPDEGSKRDQGGQEEFSQKVNSIADRAIDVANRRLDTKGLSELVSAKTAIMKLTHRDIAGERVAAEIASTRLMNEGYRIATAKKLVSHWTFTSFVESKAESLRAVGKFDEALEFLNEAVASSRKDPGDGKATFAKALSVYPSLFWLESRWPTDGAAQQRVLGAINGAFSELLMISDPDHVSSDAASDFVSALMQFGETYLARHDGDQAVLAYKAAQRIAKARKLDVGLSTDETIASQLNEAVKEQSKKSTGSKAEQQAKGYRAEVDGLGFDVLKQQKLVEAAIHLSMEEGGQPFALQFIREADAMLIADLKARASKLPLSSEVELAQQMGFAELNIFLHLQLLAQATPRTKEEQDARTEEALELFQWIDFGRAGSALQRSATRILIEKGADDARELDLTIRDWHRTQQRMIALAASGETDSSDLPRRLTRNYEHAVELRARLTNTSPLYARLSQRGKLKLVDIRAALGQGEALIAFSYDNTGGVVALFLTKETSGLVESRIDFVSEGAAAIVSLPKLAERVRDSITSRAGFDWRNANRIYRALFAKLEDDLRANTNLVIVPGKDLGAFPFAALTENVPEVPRDAKWLVGRYTFDIAPSLDSLVALRLRPSTSEATKSFVGFADPAIDSPDGSCAPVSAWGKKPATQSVICPVSETRDLVAALAQIWPGNSLVVLGKSFVESAIINDTKSRIGVLAFATHGLLSRELFERAGISQPALLLSRDPAGGAGSEWLTAQKIEQLTMDVDLVVLSACNTSASEGEKEEPLSGLARAFFEAGARGVMASSWYIDANKTSALLQEVSKRLRQAPQASMPQVLAEAMLARSRQDPNPRDWAMFSYIGR